MFAEKFIKWLTDDCCVLPETDLEYLSGCKWRIGRLAINLCQRAFSDTKLKLSTTAKEVIKIKRKKNSFLPSLKSAIVKDNLKRKLVASKKKAQIEVIQID